MQRNLLKMSRALAFAIGATIATGPAFAEKPSWAGGGKGEERGQKGKSGKGKSERQGGSERHFVDRHRTVVHDYYAKEFNFGRCPPGLAKKRNGCMPPGQAKKWQLGHPLPPDAVFYNLPPALVVEIGVPPPGYRYVRVASDILLIAIGTGMVVEAIRDLGR